MEAEKLQGKWEDICFNLSKTVALYIDEKFFEQKIEVKRPSEEHRNFKEMK